MQSLESKLIQIHDAISIGYHLSECGQLSIQEPATLLVHHMVANFSQIFRSFLDHYDIRQIKTNRVNFIKKNSSDDRKKEELYIRINKYIQSFLIITVNYQKENEPTILYIQKEIKNNNIALIKKELKKGEFQKKILILCFYKTKKQIVREILQQYRYCKTTELAYSLNSYFHESIDVTDFEYFIQKILEIYKVQLISYIQKQIDKFGVLKLFQISSIYLNQNKAHTTFKQRNRSIYGLYGIFLRVYANSFVVNKLYTIVEQFFNSIPYLIKMFQQKTTQLQKRFVSNPYQNNNNAFCLNNNQYIILRPSQDINQLIQNIYKQQRTINGQNYKNFMFCNIKKYQKTFKKYVHESHLSISNLKIQQKQICFNATGKQYRKMQLICKNFLIDTLIEPFPISIFNNQHQFLIFKKYYESAIVIEYIQLQWNENKVQIRTFGRDAEFAYNKIVQLYYQLKSQLVVLPVNKKIQHPLIKVMPQDDINEEFNDCIFKVRNIHVKVRNSSFEKEEFAVFLFDDYQQNQQFRQILKQNQKNINIGKNYMTEWYNTEKSKYLKSMLGWKVIYKNKLLYQEIILKGLLNILQLKKKLNFIVSTDVQPYFQSLFTIIMQILKGQSLTLSSQEITIFISNKHYYKIFIKFIEQQLKYSLVCKKYFSINQILRMTQWGDWNVELFSDVGNKLKLTCLNSCLFIEQQQKNTHKQFAFFAVEGKVYEYLVFLPLLQVYEIKNFSVRKMQETTSLKTAICKSALLIRNKFLQQNYIVFYANEQRQIKSSFYVCKRKKVKSGTCQLFKINSQYEISLKDKMFNYKIQKIIQSQKNLIQTHKSFIPELVQLLNKQN